MYVWLPKEHWLLIIHENDANFLPTTPDISGQNEINVSPFNFNSSETLLLSVMA